MEDEYYFYTRKINYKTIPTAYINPFRKYVQSLQKPTTQVDVNESKFLPASLPDTLIRFSPRKALYQAGKEFMPHLNLVQPVFNFFENNDIPIEYVFIRNIYGNTVERLRKSNHLVNNNVLGEATCVWIPLFDYSADHKIIELHKDGKNIKQFSPKTTFITNPKYDAITKNTNNNVYSFFCILAKINYHELKAKL